MPAYFVAQATHVLQAAGVASGSAPDGSKTESGMVRVRYCNIPLPHTQPFSPRESRVVERLFIVSQPDAFPDHILQDCLCRFGNLIDAYFMGGAWSERSPLVLIFPSWNGRV